jgi:Trk K+ transport system NAD-binding subunit
MLLSSRLSLIIAASAIALSMGLINETVNSDIILLAIITCTIAPFLFNRIYPRKAEQVRRGIIIAGQDQLAEYIIERIQTDEEPIFVICPDQSRVKPFQKLGAVIIDGCSGFDEALTQAGASQARVLLDLTADSSETLQVCQLAKQKYGIPLVISRIADVELIPDLQQAGIKVVQPELATAMALEGAIRYPTAFDVLLHQTEDIEVTEVKVKNQKYTGARLAEVRLPGDALILSLKRENTVLIPDGESRLQVNDQLGLIGSPSSIADAISMFKG